MSIRSRASSILKGSMVALLLCLLVTIPAGVGAQATQEAGKIAVVVPTAYLVRASQQLNAAPSMPVNWGDVINTGHLARARISLTDGSVLNVGSDSNLTVAKHDASAQQTDLDLNYGRVRAKAVKLVKPDAHFQIRTSVGVAGVVGTEMIVSYETAVSSSASNNTSNNATSAKFVRSDTTTQGNWHGAYGGDGYSVANDTQSIPAYASFAPQNQSTSTWQPDTVDPRALQKGSGSGRIASTWYNSHEFNLDVNFTDGNAHQFALYSMDWDSLGRSEVVQVLDAATGAVLDTQTLSGFTSGVYLVWNISGHVNIKVTQTGSGSAVVSGVFFDRSGAILAGAVAADVRKMDLICLEGACKLCDNKANCVLMKGGQVSSIRGNTAPSQPAPVTPVNVAAAQNATATTGAAATGAGGIGSVGVVAVGTAVGSTVATVVVRAVAKTTTCGTPPPPPTGGIVPHKRANCTRITTGTGHINGQRAP